MIERRHSRARRLLRSVLIAGAGAAVWMALSATAANADSGNNNHGSLLGGVKSTASAASQGILGGGVPVVAHELPPVVASSVPDAVNPVEASRVALPQPAPQAMVHKVPVPVPVPQNVVPEIAGVLDDVAAAVPVVESVAPENTVTDAVSAVAEPVVGTVEEVAAVLPPPLADALRPVTDTADEVASAVLPPVTGALDEILDPGRLPGPGQLLDLPDPSALAAPGTLGSSPKDLRPSAPFTDVAGSFAGQQTGLALTGAAGLYTRARAPATSSAPEGPGGSPGPHGPPATIPAVYGAGSGHSAGDGFGGSAAWLHSNYDFSVRPWVVLGFPAGEQHPSSVYFDPGSSPD